jgi:hypothetical protein
MRFVYTIFCSMPIFLPEGGAVLGPGVGLLGQPAPERTVFVPGPAFCEDDDQLAAGDAKKC